LDVTSNAVRSIGTLSEMTALKHLDAGFNAIVALDGLEGLTSLEWLAVHGNPVTDFSPVAHLPNLRTLVHTIDERCGMERDYVRAHNLASGTIVDTFTRRKFGPIYTNPKNRDAGVDGWAHCEISTQTY
jgi:hypothetical protein